jgi:hypothetical protein
LYCALAPGLEEKSGCYFAGQFIFHPHSNECRINLIVFFVYFVTDCKVKEPNPLANDPENTKKLWEISAKLVGLSETI